MDDVIRQLLHLASEGPYPERQEDDDDERGDDDDSASQPAARVSGSAGHR